MRGKLLFITGGLIGYVLGARAGRKRYDQIAAAANNLWNAEPVQRRVTMARDFTLDAVGDLPVTLFNAGKKVVENVQAKKSAKDAAGPAQPATPTATPKPAAKPASKTAAKPAATSASKPAADPTSENSSF
ncbi:YtxH domain-containing protein [Leifsonia sp. YAF41]|uniref:YtxH domain-containing protein n=1 Tax=Leifsonia sp. YAF41 TaxID=3233086 RepID=UPI003F9B49E2